MEIYGYIRENPVFESLKQRISKDKRTILHYAASMDNNDFNLSNNDSTTKWRVQEGHSRENESFLEESEGFLEGKVGIIGGRSPNSCLVMLQLILLGESKLQINNLDNEICDGVIRWGINTGTMITTVEKTMDDRKYFEFDDEMVKAQKAAATNKWELFAEIIDKRERLIDPFDLFGNTAIHAVARAGKTEIFRKLLNNMLSETERLDALRWKNLEGNTVLHEAVMLDDPKMVDVILGIDKKIMEGVMLDTDKIMADDKRPLLELQNNACESPAYRAANLHHASPTSHPHTTPNLREPPPPPPPASASHPTSTRSPTSHRHLHASPRESPPTSSARPLQPPPPPREPSRPKSIATQPHHRQPHTVAPTKQKEKRSQPSRMRR
ncbi:hypothetical protein Fmac_011048 [Flemingia macrophylla]|uniref:Uncharacterized protein n=1 Tax=Flemingia macrophylla TaxID=520843 RepID=A0ABD1MM44_9FABA